MSTGSDRRKDMLLEVEELVCNVRQYTYGDAEENFADIATIANILFKHKLEAPLDAVDVSMFCCAIKIARCAASPHHQDNHLDLAGYAICSAGIIESKKEPKA